LIPQLTRVTHPIFHLDSPPIIIDRSFGGGFTQILLDRGAAPSGGRRACDRQGRARPEQHWSLRVTWVFRRTAESDWEVVHRHADPLVHAIDHERLGALARGQ